MLAHTPKENVTALTDDGAAGHKTHNCSNVAPTTSVPCPNAPASARRHRARRRAPVWARSQGLRRDGSTRVARARRCSKHGDDLAADAAVAPHLTSAREGARCGRSRLIAEATVLFARGITLTAANDEDARA